MQIALIKLVEAMENQALARPQSNKPAVHLDSKLNEGLGQPPNREYTHAGE